jgi:hypothetical protein
LLGSYRAFKAAGLSLAHNTEAAFPFSRCHSGPSEARPTPTWRDRRLDVAVIQRAHLPST